MEDTRGKAPKAPRHDFNPVRAFPLTLSFRNAYQSRSYTVMLGTSNNITENRYRLPNIALKAEDAIFAFNYNGHDENFIENCRRADFIERLSCISIFLVKFVL